MIIKNKLKTSNKIIKYFKQVTFSNIVIVLHILIKFVKYKLQLTFDHLHHNLNLKNKLSWE